MTMPWLNRYVLTNTSTVHPWLFEVFRWHDWSVASDRRGLIAVRDGGISAKQPGKPVTHSLVDELMGATFDAPLLTTSLLNLWHWCGYVEHEICERCNGSGCEEDIFTEDGSPFPCIDCEGTGETGLYPMRPGYLAEVCIDRNRLAWMLPSELLEYDGGTVAVNSMPLEGKAEPGRAVVLTGARWRVFLHQMDLKAPAWDGEEIDPTTHVPDPRLCGYTPHRMLYEDDAASRRAFADWMQEVADG